MPENIKDFGISFCVALLWILAFGLIKLLPLLIETLEFHGTMFLFAIFCLSGASFILVCMPETKFKSYDEIMRALS